MQAQRMATALGFGLAALIGRAPASAQVRTQTLNTPDTTFEEAFSLVNGLLELPDGRVMIADPLGQALVIVDLATGRADTIGRVGQGPEEYRQPDGLFALPGDSILMVDLGNARLTALGPDGTFGPTMPVAQGEPAGPGMSGMMIVLPQDVDDRGRLYFQPLGFGGPGGRLPDSATVVRLDRASGAFDTVATVKIRELRRRTSGGANNRNVAIQQVPYSPQDGWAVAADGRVAVVRSQPYRVEWIHPDGHVVRGSPIEFRPVRIRTAEKEEWVKRSSNGLSVGVSVNNGVRQMSFRRGAGGRGGNPDINTLPWPDTKPAFDPNGILVDPDGNVWVERHAAAGEPRTFDVFDHTGNRQAEVTLPTGRQVVGFGRGGALYVVLTDEYDLQYLERYRLES